MTEQEVQAFCANNGISVSPVGRPLHVVDPTELPASVRKFVSDDGTYKGGDAPESEERAATEEKQGVERPADEEESKPEPKRGAAKPTKKAGKK